MPEHSTKPNDSQLFIREQYQPRLTKLAEACSSPTATQKDADAYTKEVEKRNREMIAEKSSITDYQQYENIIGKLAATITELKENQDASINETKEFKKIIQEQRKQLESLDNTQKKTEEFERTVVELQEQISKLQKK